jgi:hypothetical protein
MWPRARGCLGEGALNPPTRGHGVLGCASVDEFVVRSVSAGAIAVALAVGLINLRSVPRDLALTCYAVVVAILGIFAILGPLAAFIGGLAIVAVFCLGALVYAVLALVTPR